MLCDLDKGVRSALGEVFFSDDRVQSVLNIHIETFGFELDRSCNDIEGRPGWFFDLQGRQRF